MDLQATIDNRVADVLPPHGTRCDISKAATEMQTQMVTCKVAISETQDFCTKYGEPTRSGAAGWLLP